KTLGPRTLAIYLTTLTIGSLALGCLFNVMVDPKTTMPDHMHEHGTWLIWLYEACAVALLALLAWFAWEDALSWLRKRRAADAADYSKHYDAGRVEIGVEGMTCGNCVARLKRVLGREEGVSSVDVSLKPGRAVVRGSVSPERVRELV